MDFFELHHQDQPWILPNAWDVASAALLAREGFPAIGTTSFGLAAGSGERDAHGLTRDSTRDLGESLAGLTCMVTLDIEDGFSARPEAVAEYAAGLTADGINVEDSSGGGLIDPTLHAAKVAAVKERRADLFLNARVDTYWLGQQATPVETVRRAHAYVDAGADGIFIPGDVDLPVLRAMCSEIPVPVNALASARHTPAELFEAGVRRISTGSLLYRQALTAGVAVARSLRDGSTAPRDVLGYEAVDDLSQA